MGKIEIPLALTFDDVLLVPRESAVLPRSADTTTKLGDLTLPVPLLSAAMDTVTGARLATAMATLGGLGIVHKNQPIDAQAEAVRATKVARASAGSAVDARGRLLVGAAVGVGAPERAAALVDAGVDALVVDTAHGHARSVLATVSALRERFPRVTLIGGNVATAEATAALYDHGADVVKVGVGPGSICTTRIVAGVGVPQLSAILDAAEVAESRGRTLIADGGVRYAGDVAKALAAGAHAVMCGGLFAGCDEAPGETLILDGKPFRVYRGMGSEAAMRAGSADRYFQADASDPEAHLKKLVAEGVVARVPAKGPLADVIALLLGGLRASMGYCGAADLAILRAESRFVRITAAGLRESHVHDVLVDGG